jgi:hypothetical protein
MSFKCKVEDCYIQGRGFAGSRRQIKDVRPSTFFGDLAYKPRLPGKWRVAMDLCKKGSEFLE